YRRLTESPPSAPLPGPATSSPTRKRRAIPTCRMTDLPNHLGTEVTVAGVLFAERRARTKTGEFMKFISLEDETGVVEAVLLPNAYQRLGGRITTRGPYRVTGTVEDHFGAVSLLVSDLVPLGSPANPCAVV
ncbi:MAG TPA: OB-fold nucleic acid binding domain-containing protein, partial [Phycisphaerae bacterium]|nr:OB-fold nucleic acid binding domain-containing protein [Phycisphaerae bacterium]